MADGKKTIMKQTTKSTDIISVTIKFDHLCADHKPYLERGRPRTRSVKLTSIFRTTEDMSDRNTRFKIKFSDRVKNFPFHPDLIPKTGIKFTLIGNFFQKKKQSVHIIF